MKLILTVYFIRSIAFSYSVLKLCFIILAKTRGVKKELLYRCIIFAQGKMVHYTSVQYFFPKNFFHFLKYFFKKKTQI